MEQPQEQQAHYSSTMSSGFGSGLTSIGFARLARSLIEIADTAGAPDLTFRSPGRVGVGRAIRRNADGSATIAVRYRGRPAISVAADMIEGVVQAGGTSLVAGHVRDALWLAAGSVLIGESGVTFSAESSRRSPRSVATTRDQSSAVRSHGTDSGSGPPDQATRRAA